MISAAPSTPELDGAFVLHQIEVGKAAWQHYHEIALWNPYDCRGIPMWDHPESMTASPILLLATRLPALHTLILWNVVHCAFGFASMWLLARREVGLSRASAFVAAVMWGCSTAHISQYAGAHGMMVDFWLAPLLLLLWRRAEHDYRHAIALGATIAFMVYEGATYPLPYVVLVVALETLTRAAPRRLVSIARAGAIAGAVAIGLSAARLFPLVDQLLSHKRDAVAAETDALLDWYVLQKMYLWREGHWWVHLPEHTYVWGEYVAYVGALASVLALIGVLVAVREQRWLVAIGAVTALLMLGHFSNWAPWELLQGRVFPFKSLRVPSRFRLLLQLPIALWVALAVERAPRLLERIAGAKNRDLSAGVRAALLGVALISAGDAIGLGKDIIDMMHKGAPLKYVEASPNFYYEGPDLAAFLDQPRQNRAWIGCRSYEWPSNSDAAVRTGDVPQAVAMDATVAQVLDVKRTVNTFRVRVDAKQPTVLLLNSGFGEGWRTNVGTVVEKDKMLAVEIPAGRWQIKVRYLPRTMRLGIIISIATAVATVLAWNARAPLLAFRAARARARRR